MYGTAEENAPEVEIDNDAPEKTPGDVETENDTDNGEADNHENGDGETNGDEDSEQEFYFGDEKLDSPASEETKDPALVKHLRGTIKEKERELKELRRQTQQPAAQQPVITQAPRMPKLDDDDIGYDEAVYQERMTKWAKENGEYLQQEHRRQHQEQELQRVYQDKLSSYQQRVKSLKVAGYQEAEQSVIDELPVQTQNMILMESDKPEMVILALGRNPDLRKQLADATSPVAIGRLLGQIESKAKIMPKAKTTAATTPEVKGINGAAINNLDKLLEKARATGDYTAYRAAKNKAKK
ncbi:scaffolding protein [Citrobacter sp. Marseille-Q6884]|uniref:scaffolding protein n=1 Tax=Citrobacter sp. Marseille-Q6884 TaxID=2956786 RepID=UPI0021B4680F|nr:scaffolding protein [Citrobacter sp. Marseille-Q6884]